MRTLQHHLIIGAACAIGACAGSTASIEQSWRSPSARADDLTKVVTLAHLEDGAMRRNAEDKLALQLRRRGMEALPAYMVLSEADRGNQQRALGVMRENGFDGVVAMRFFPPHQTFDYDPGVYSWWGDTWNAVIPETIVRVEVNAYALKNDRLVWSAMSSSIDPEDSGELLDDVTAVVGREIGRQRVISAAPTTTRPPGA